MIEEDRIIELYYHEVLEMARRMIEGPYNKVCITDGGQYVYVGTLHLGTKNTQVLFRLEPDAVINFLIVAPDGSEEYLGCSAGMNDNNDLEEIHQVALGLLTEG